MSTQPYWDKRYSQGGDSGAGSEGKERDWKWNIILKHAEYAIFKDVILLDEVIDVGCGDLKFWDAVVGGHFLNCKDYVGIDFSKVVIEQDKEESPLWKFILADASIIQDLKPRKVVLCLDLLFHIMDDWKIPEILRNLCSYSSDLIFIHNWVCSPFLFGMVTDGQYQHFWALERYFNIFFNRGFALIDIQANPNQIGAMYVFKKVRE